MLRSSISHYWLSGENQDSGHPIFPDGCVDVVFRIGRTTSCRVYGAATRRSSCLVSPGYYYLGICFKPGQAHRFLRDSLGQFTNLNSELSGLAGLKPEALADDIASGVVFEYLDRSLATWLERQSSDRDYVSQALHSIDRHYGNIRIETVAAQLALSRRQLERIFSDFVGMSPKTYASIRRWQRALILLQTAPTLSLATIALDAGYADQSHMNRDFRRFWGQPPKLTVDVAFVQDRPLPPDYILRMS